MENPPDLLLLERWREHRTELRRRLYAAEMNEAGFAAFEPGGSERILAILDAWRPGPSTILPGSSTTLPDP